MRPLCELILTAPPSCDVDAFIHQLVEDRLCAAGHRDQITTTYHWDGEIRTATEHRAILHTTVDRIADLQNAISRWHPYEIPCIAHRELAANDAYAHWVRARTSPSD